MLNSVFEQLPHVLLMTPYGLFTIAAIVMVVFWLGKKLYKSRKQKASSYNFHGSLSTPEQIKAALNAAIVQRQPFELEAGASSDTHRPTLQCTPTALAKESLTLEVPEVALSEHWLNKPITLSFRIKNNQKFTYYTYTTAIESITPTATGCHLTVLLPATIEKRQQRSFLRIAPPLEYIYGAAIWYGDTMPHEDQLPDLHNWLKPTLFYIPGSIDQFSITDLSANGIQLFFPNALIQAHSLRLSTLDRFIVMLDLYSAETNGRLRFWLQCKAQRIAFQETNEGFFTGARFMAWGKPRHPLPEQALGTIEWFRVPTSREVEPLSNWIMHRHLDKFRILDDNANI